MTAPDTGSCDTCGKCGWQEAPAGRYLCDACIDAVSPPSSLATCVEAARCLAWGAALLPAGLLLLAAGRRVRG